MNNRDISRELRRNGLKIWQLCQALGVSRSTYYTWSHRSFAGRETTIRQGMKDAIDKQNMADLAGLDAKRKENAK